MEIGVQIRFLMGYLLIFINVSDTLTFITRHNFKYKTDNYGRIRGSFNDNHEVGLFT